MALLIFAFAARWAYLILQRRRRQPRVSRVGTQFIAGPEGLWWVRQAAGQEWKFPAADVVDVRLHLSPWEVRRTHPVSVVLELTNGDRHVLGQGALDEATLIADSIADGLGLAKGEKPSAVAGV